MTTSLICMEYAYHKEELSERIIVTWCRVKAEGKNEARTGAGLWGS